MNEKHLAWGGDTGGSTNEEAGLGWRSGGGGSRVEMLKRRQGCSGEAKEEVGLGWES